MYEGDQAVMIPGPNESITGFQQEKYESAKQAAADQKLHRRKEKMDKDSCIYYDNGICLDGKNCSYAIKTPNGRQCKVGGKCGKVNSQEKRTKEFHITQRPGEGRF